MLGLVSESCTRDQQLRLRATSGGRSGGRSSSRNNQAFLAPPKISQSAYIVPQQRDIIASGCLVTFPLL